MVYKVGDKVRVSFTATVESTGDAGNVNSTCAVTETAGAGAGFEHFMYLNSSRARDQVLKGGSAYVGFRDPDIGSEVEVSFEATIDSIEDGPSRTSTVTSGPGDGDGQRYYHSVYLESPSVTPVTGEKAEEAPPVAYPAGQDFRAEFTAVVKEAGTGPFSCDRVEEDGNGRTHFLFLAGPESRKTVLAAGQYLAARPAAGDRIAVAFTGKVSELGEQRDGTRAVATPRSNGTTARWNHALDLSSPSVRPLAENESYPGKEPSAMSFKAGDRVLVKFTGTISSGIGARQANTTAIRDDKDWTHWLCLSSPAVSPDGKAPSGGKATVEFTARVTRTDGPISTIAVEDDNDYVHYVFPGSPYVTMATAYKPGDALRVRFTGTVTGRLEKSASITTTVTDSAGYEHFLFLGDREVFPGTGPAVGDKVTVNFTCKVYDPLQDSQGKLRVRTQNNVHYLDTASPSVFSAKDAPALARDRFAPGQPIRAAFTATVLDASGYDSTTRVREEATGIVHSLYFGADARKAILPGADLSARPAQGAVVRVAFETIVPETPLTDRVPAGQVAVQGPDGRFRHFLDLSSPGITAIGPDGAVPGYETLRYDTIGAEIAALEAKGQFRVRRLRTDVTVFSGATREDCAAFLDREDFNPERFSVEGAGLSPADVTALELLRTVSARAAEKFGRYWVTSRASYFTEEWAKDEATEFENIEESALDKWPLTLVNWAAAAIARRDKTLDSFSVNGETWYGEEI